jgi:L-ribulose-5-phosphate 3-epimerase
LLEEEDSMPQIKLGVMAPLPEGPEEALQKVADFGFPSCQVVCWDDAFFTDEVADRLHEAANRLNVEITTIWTGAPGRYVWNFIEGPTTIGLVPIENRTQRVVVLKRGADFAARVGAPSITTHVGFIPENPSDPNYPGVVAAIREVAEHCRDLGLEFWFETGQETPITLLRTIEDVGTGNLGINLDPANLLLYGKANPVDALDVFGQYVRGVHAKDGEYPTNGRNLGEEKALGEGRVNFPALVAKLKALGYSDALTIEREISGPRQVEDIRRGKDFLTALL